MKKYIHLTLAILVTFPLNAKVEILDRVAIIVGDGVVLESQINSMLKSIEQRFAEQGAALPPAESMLEQVRERLIIEELQLQMAIRGGVRVGDGELNQAFEEIAKNNEMTLEAFIESLESEGASYEELRDQVRKEMIIQRVQRGKVGRQVDITEQELDGFLATEGSVKELSPELFIRQILVEDKIKAEKVLSDLESGEDFQVLAKERSTNANAASGGEMGWRNLADLPSLFADALKGKKKGYVSPPLESGSGFFVLQLEDKRGNLVRFEEQWNARHILMMPTKLRDETFTKSELEAVRDRAMAGEDFALLAKEFSEDPGSASRGGDLEWLSLGKTAPAFEKMMTTSPLQEISPVFESEFGFHFLQVLGQRTEDLTEEVIKDRAYGIIFARKYDEELENSLRTMRAEAFVEFKELD
ncbi:MAG: peptidyl-prolyl cis-trans isomerase SurA [Candidatus Pseudothioglobus sp.]|jgi:peptidyl-prolyl cis-trans isomerase SurA|nr:peptidylprolyl isomerase [Gammaproteobacteria bacterium]MDA9344423.1 peptidylprolyl isomerase [Gammaproteobacteria bacterium]MDA9971005.1 peptidylprolyl isomerase [Gammaproteobacteria bacterium]MDB4242426.1 peptidylprolyl isomerase [Gammaproteobacteria bacterium]MDC0090200.1 peptidylprolyl isomerase [Gammaproteobacteria bacterium]|tara:strand:- start:490 stop:1734 length:1245 start_codon:yes stop_codon:yes gene_type:complete